MSTTTTLWWPGRLLAEDDLRRHWQSQGEIVLGTKTIVTPLADEFLRAKRVAIRREDKASDTAASTVWGVAEEKASPLIAAAVKALMQEGRTLTTLESASGDLLAWIRSIAKRIVQGNPPGAVIVSEQAALAAAIANKIAGVRAASVSQPVEVAALQKLLGPNVYTIAAAGRTYFELRQLLKLTTNVTPTCPPNLRGLDDAHR